MSSKARQNLSKRLRDYGFNPGLLPIGSTNLISDVPGIKVGHYTKIEGATCRTGITLVDPGINNLYEQKVPAAVVTGNGFGKLVGYTQLEELGTLETPIALTNTLAVGPVSRGLVDLVLERSKINKQATINAVVGEVNDSYLNDIHEDNLNSSDVKKAAENLTTDFDLGAVGAGASTRAFSWKGGIGSSSRIISIDGKSYSLGALVQTNFGGSLTIMGVPVGQILGKHDFNFTKDNGADGSCMIVIATDAPISSRQLKRIAHRGLFGMVRAGSIMAHGSGDYAIAFSTSRAGIETTDQVCLADEHLNPLFLASVEAVEESIYDALFSAETVSNSIGKLERLPVDEVAKFLRKRL